MTARCVAAPWSSDRWGIAEVWPAQDENPRTQRAAVRTPFGPTSEEERDMRRVLAVLVGVIAAAAIGVHATDARSGGEDHGGQAILRFDTMTPVDGPFVGATHPVRTLA